MLVRNPRAAVACTTHAGLLDQLPCLVALGVLEGRAPRLLADRLRVLAFLFQRCHARGDRSPVARARAKTCAQDDRAFLDVRAAVAQPQVLASKGADDGLEACSRHARPQHAHFLQNLLRIASFCACVHPDRSADGAGDANEEFQAAACLACCETGERSQTYSCARLDCTVVKPCHTRQARSGKDNSLQTSICDQQVRARS